MSNTLRRRTSDRLKNAEKEIRKRDFYICDPKKNVACGGRYAPHCGVQCFCTTNPEYAKDPEHILTEKEYRHEESMRRKLNHALDSYLKKSPGKEVVETTPLS